MTLRASPPGTRANNEGSSTHPLLAQPLGCAPPEGAPCFPLGPVERKDDLRGGSLWVMASPSSGPSGWLGPKSFLLSSLSHRQLWLSPAQSGSDDSRCCEGSNKQAGFWVQGVAAAKHTPHPAQPLP